MNTYKVQCDAYEHLNGMRYDITLNINAERPIDALQLAICWLKERGYYELDGKQSRLAWVKAVPEYGVVSYSTIKSNTLS